jgi:hypothetical protein
MDRLNDMLAESGLDEASLNRALQRNAPQLGVFKNWNEQQKMQVAIEGVVGPEGKPVGGIKNAVMGLMHIMSQSIGDPDMGSNYAARFQREFRVDKGNEAYADFVADYNKKLRKEAEAPLKKKIADLETQIAGGKVASRKDGPDTAQKGGGGKTDAERMLDPNTSTEELRQIRARQRAG